MKHILTLTALLMGFVVAQASDIDYVFHFNVDENLAGEEEPIPSGNWNLHYGPTATDGIGDANIVSGLSQGGTGNPVVPLPDLRNNDRGFIFASGAGDSTTGFAPEALFFWRTDLTTSSLLQGGKASGGVQVDWAVAVTPPEKALADLTLGDLLELSINARPRNDATDYRLALRLGTDWYVDAAGFNTVGPGWQNYAMSVPGASLYPLPFTPGTELDVEVTDNTAVTVASLDPDLAVTGYGIYADTNGFKGTSNNTGSWTRADVLHIRAIARPKVRDVAKTGTTFDAVVDSASGVKYTLVRDTVPNGTYTTAVDGPVSGDDTEKTLTDPDTSTAGSDTIFYKVTGEIE